MKINLRLHWPDIIILLFILISLPVAYLGTLEITSTYSDLEKNAISTGEYREFISQFPSSEIYITHPAEKGTWMLFHFPDDDFFLQEYSEDILYDFFLNSPLDRKDFPTVWLVSVSPYPETREESFMPHPPKPVLFILYDEDLNKIYSEVYQ